MPFDGNGNFSPVTPEYPAIAGTLIEAAKWNSVVSDLSDGLSNALCRDGQSSMLSSLNMGGFKVYNALAGGGTGEGLTFEQLFSSPGQLLNSLLGVTQAVGDNTAKLATTAFVTAAAFSAALPAQAGNAGRFIGTDGATASWVDAVPSTASYASLRLYAGPATCIRITGYAAAAAPSYQAGVFVVDPTDAVSVDNGGTTIVDSLGRRWKRVFDGTVDVRWFGAKGDGATDDTTAIQNAVNSAFHAILFPGGTYLVSAQITIATPACRLFSEQKGMFSPYSTTIKYVGPASATTALFKVSNGTHGVEIDGLRFDGNLLAGICVFVEALAGSSTHQPSLRNVFFTGYTSRGLVMGENNIAALKNGQMQTPRLDRLYFYGGTVGAIGFLLNAQNCEFAVCSGLYFDPDPGKEHLNHIFAYSGGVNIQGLLTTRATDYAIYSAGSQVMVHGWRAEDRYLFKTAAVAMEGPCVFSGVLSRGGAVLPADYIFQFLGIDSELVFNGAALNGSIALGATDRRYVDGGGVTFTAVGAGWVHLGPQNQVGWEDDFANTQTTFRGSKLLIKSAGGVDWGGWDGVSLRGKQGATGMTDGFIAIPSAAGGPTGAPAPTANTVPLYYDATNNRLCAYNGAWKKTPFGILAGSAAWDPPSIANGAQATTVIAVAGAVVGSMVRCAWSGSLAGLQLTGYVSAVDTVVAVLSNTTGGAIDLAAGTVTAWVET